MIMRSLLVQTTLVLVVFFSATFCRALAPPSNPSSTKNGAWTSSTKSMMEVASTTTTSSVPRNSVTGTVAAALFGGASILALTPAIAQAADTLVTAAHPSQEIQLPHISINLGCVVAGYGMLANLLLEGYFMEGGSAAGAADAVATSSDLQMMIPNSNDMMMDGLSLDTTDNAMMLAQNGAADNIVETTSIVPSSMEEAMEETLRNL